MSIKNRLKSIPLMFRVKLRFKSTFSKKVKKEPNREKDISKPIFSYGVSRDLLGKRTRHKFRPDDVKSSAKDS